METIQKNQKTKPAVLIFSMSSASFHDYILDEARRELQDCSVPVCLTFEMNKSVCKSICDILFMLPKNSIAHIPMKTSETLPRSKPFIET